MTSRHSSISIRPLTAWFSVLMLSLLSDSVTSLAVRDDIGNDATAYTLPQITIMAEFATPSVVTPQEQAAASATALQAPLQEQTELHLAVFMIQDLSSQQSLLQFDDLVSFSLDMNVYTIPFNNTHTLLQVDAQGLSFWLNRPSSKDVTGAMLSIYEEAFLTPQGLDDLRIRYQSQLGFNGLEMLRTRVQDQKYNVRTGKRTGIAASLPLVPAIDPDTPAASSSPTTTTSTSKNPIAIIAAVLVVCSFLLAGLAVYFSRRHYAQRVTAASNNKQSKSVNKDEEKGSKQPDSPTDQVDDDLYNFDDLEAGISDENRIYVPWLHSEKDHPQPVNLLRDWKGDALKPKYGQSVRKDRVKAPKPTGFVKIVALSTPTTAPKSPSEKPVVAESSREVLASPIQDKAGLLKEEPELPKYGKDSALSKGAAKLEQTLEDLYDLSCDGDESVTSISLPNEVSVNEEACEMSSCPVKLLIESPVEEATAGAVTTSAADNQAEHHTGRSTAAIAHGTLGVATNGKVKPSDLMRAWSHDEKNASSIKNCSSYESQASSNDGQTPDLIRVWDYNEESSIEHVSSCDDDNDGQPQSESPPNHQEPIDEFPVMDHIGYIIQPKDKDQSICDDATEPTVDITYETEAGLP